jgi:hypothetical protein
MRWELSQWTVGVGFDVVRLVGGRKQRENWICARRGGRGGWFWLGPGAQLSDSMACFWAR